MKFLLICFHSVGKVLKYDFLKILPDGAIFQVWPIRQTLALFLFSASANYRANCINNPAIIVRGGWYGCQSVVCMRVIQKQLCVCACVLVIF